VARSVALGEARRAAVDPRPSGAARGAVALHLGHLADEPRARHRGDDVRRGQRQAARLEQAGRRAPRVARGAVELGREPVADVAADLRARLLQGGVGGPQAREDSDRHARLPVFRNDPQERARECRDPDRVSIDREGVQARVAGARRAARSPASGRAAAAAAGAHACRRAAPAHAARSARRARAAEGERGRADRLDPHRRSDGPPSHPDPRARARVEARRDGAADGGAARHARRAALAVVGHGVPALPRRARRKPEARRARRAIELRGLPGHVHDRHAGVRRGHVPRAPVDPRRARSGLLQCRAGAQGSHPRAVDGAGEGEGARDAGAEARALHRMATPRGRLVPRRRRPRRGHRRVGTASRGHGDQGATVGDDRARQHRGGARAVHDRGSEVEGPRAARRSAAQLPGVPRPVLRGVHRRGRAARRGRADAAVHRSSVTSTRCSGSCASFAVRWSRRSATR
jgi:hypothetical protein